MNSIFNPDLFDESFGETEYLESDVLDDNIQDDDIDSSSESSSNTHRRGKGRGYKQYKAYSSYREALVALEEDPELYDGASWAKGNALVQATMF
jgi:hypothetical protein